MMRNYCLLTHFTVRELDAMIACEKVCVRLKEVWQIVVYFCLQLALVNFYFSNDLFLSSRFK